LLKTARNDEIPVIPACTESVPTPGASWYPNGDAIPGMDAGSASERSIVAVVQIIVPSFDPSD
jgi:hypothetical protein